MPGKGQIPFEPWEFQQEFMNCRDRFRIINKPRQCGISTTVANEVAWEFDNVPGAQIVIISKDKDAAINFHTYVYNILYSVRKNNKDAPKLIKTNERVTTNDIGSKISSLASSKESGRSFSATHLIFDELAFIEYAEDIWQAANATLSQTKGRVTAISTPKGRANLFARIFESQDHMGFTVFQYAWWDVPTYNPFYEQYKKAESPTEKKQWIEKAKNGEWYRAERPKYTDLAWRQEFEGAFDANAGTVFSTRMLEQAFHRNWLKEADDPHQILTEWWTSDFDENSLYAVGIDLGRKNDPTVIVTYDYTNRPYKLVDFKYIEAGRCEWDDIESVLEKHFDKWSPDISAHDATGVGDSMNKVLEKYGSDPFIFTKNNKQSIIELTQHAMGCRAIRVPKIPILFREHQRYIWDDKDIVQDTVMANALAISNIHDPEDVLVGYKELNFVGSTV